MDNPFILLFHKTKKIGFIYFVYFYHLIFWGKKNWKIMQLEKKLNQLNYGNCENEIIQNLVKRFERDMA